MRIGLLLVMCAACSAGCWPAPGATVAHTTAVLYTRGARQSTVSAKLKIPPERVFEGMIRAARTIPELDVFNRDHDAFLLELSKADVRLAAQATDLGDGRTLLFVWADAGTSGETGRDLAIDAIEGICEELGVRYEIVGY